MINGILLINTGTRRLLGIEFGQALLLITHLRTK